MPDDEQTPPVPRLQEQVIERLQAERIVVLDGELDDKIGTRLCSQLFVLSSDDPRTDISLWINSPGGSVPAMLAIMDTIRLIPNDVSTLAMGLACSAGQFLLTVGTKGKRFALQNARIIIHQPATEGGYGQSSDIEIQANEIMRMRSLLETMLAESSGRTPEQVRVDIERDKIMTAAEAVEYGMIDEVIKTRKVATLSTR